MCHPHVPVLVEGPVDALALDLATAGRAMGVSPLGTALTAAQSDSLWPYLIADHPGVVVATDGDPAGRTAAGRAFWLLAAQGGNPRHLALPAGTDPASLLTAEGPDALRRALAAAPTLAASLVRDCVARYADRMDHTDGPMKARRRRRHGHRRARAVALGRARRAARRPDARNRRLRAGPGRADRSAMAADPADLPVAITRAQPD